MISYIISFIIIVITLLCAVFSFGKETIDAPSPQARQGRSKKVRFNDTKNVREYMTKTGKIGKQYKAKV
jgi:hypothetical protein